MQNKQKRIINMTKGMYDRPVIEPAPQKGSFFYDVYNEAWKKLIRIENNSLNNDNLRFDNKFGDKFNPDIHGGNHIIFTSNRGQGKTSALLSFVSQLATKDSLLSKEPNKKVSLEISSNSKCRYHFLNSMIDPSSFQKGESLIRVFLSKIINQYNDEYKQIKDSNSEYSNNSLVTDNEIFLKHMSQCFRDLETIKNAGRNIPPGLDSIDRLVLLGDSQNLSTNIDKLIQCYLKIVSNLDVNDSNPIDFLVVCIDDADLSMNHTYEICEDIKNYLNTENIILLISADLDQMETSVMQKYAKNYTGLLHNSYADSEALFEDCRNLANKYINKIFPLDERIYLPVVNNISDSGSINYVINFNDISGNKFAKELSGCECIQEQLTKLIFDRTGIILVKGEGEKNEFLPTSMRDMAYLVNTLDDMKRVDYMTDIVQTWNQSESDSKREKLLDIQNNINTLESYYRHVWAPSVLEDYSYSLIKKIYNTKHKDWERDIINMLDTYFVPYEDEEPSEIDNAYRYIFDVLFHRMQQSRSDSLLISAIKLHMTFYLHKKMYEIWDDENALSKFGEYIGTSFSHSSPLYKSLWNGSLRVFNTYSKYDDLKIYYSDGDRTVFENNTSPYLNHIILNKNEDIEFDVYGMFIKTFKFPSIAKFTEQLEGGTVNNDAEVSDDMDIGNAEEAFRNIYKYNYDQILDSMIVLLNPVFQEELLKITFSEESSNIPSDNNRKAISIVCNTWIGYLKNYGNDLLKPLDIKLTLPSGTYDKDSGIYETLVLTDIENIKILKEKIDNWTEFVKAETFKMLQKLETMKNVTNMNKKINEFIEKISLKDVVDSYTASIEGVQGNLWKELNSEKTSWIHSKEALDTHNSFVKMLDTIKALDDKESNGDDIIKIFKETVNEVFTTGDDIEDESFDS